MASTVAVAQRRLASRVLPYGNKPFHCVERLVAAGRATPSRSIAERGDLAMESNAHDRGVESVARAMDILDELTKGPQRLSDLGRACGLRPSTVHRLLATLSRSGHVRRIASGEYALGLRAMRIGMTAQSGLSDFHDAVAPFLGRVHRVSRRTSNLFAINEFSALLLEQLADCDAGKLNVRIGAQLPAHATASGKLSLAYGTRDEVDRLIEHGTFKAYTDNTITEPARLREEIDRVRERGFATSDCEYGQLTHGIAAPVFDATNTAIGALGLSLLTAKPKQLPTLAIEELGELVGCAAAEASIELGYTGPSRWLTGSAA
jgi:DNA-binding IclR family transcriptional regulator